MEKNPFHVSLQSGGRFIFSFKWEMAKSDKVNTLQEIAS